MCILMFDFHVGGHTCPCPLFPPEGSAGLQMMSLLGRVGQSLGLHKTKLLSIGGALYRFQRNFLYIISRTLEIKVRKGEILLCSLGFFNFFVIVFSYLIKTSFI